MVSGFEVDGQQPGLYRDLLGYKVAGCILLMKANEGKAIWKRE